jgi:hypothetical protein
MSCSFCGGDTSFLAHSPRLCLPCGDSIQAYDAKQVLELALRAADCGAAYRDLHRDSMALHKAVDAIPVEHWTDAVKVAMPCLAFTQQT